MAPQGESRFGVLELDEDKSHAASRRMRVLVVATLSAVGMLVSVLAFDTTRATSATGASSAINVADVVRDGQTQKDGNDCRCKTECFPAPEGEVDQNGRPVLWGECMTDSADGNCIGVDYLKAYPVDNDAGGVDYWTHCQIVNGAYDCGAFPCKNGGYCFDGDDAFTCSCPWGWSGLTCELDIDECSRDTAIIGVEERPCHPNAKCANRDQGYSCVCNNGFFGDGYAVDQLGGHFGGSILDPDTYSAEEGGTRYGWLDRTIEDEANKKDATGAWLGQYDINEDGIYDSHGCTDKNDCAANPCQNGGRCIDLYDGVYWDEDGVRQLAMPREMWELKQPNAYMCDCQVTFPGTLWVGQHCETNVNECDVGKHNCESQESARCEDTDGSFNCLCKAHWQGDGYRVTDDRPTPADWAADSPFSGCTDIVDCEVITTLDTDSDGDGNNDVLISTPCQNGGTCSEPLWGTGEYDCACVAGWTDAICAADIDECLTMSLLEMGCDENAHCHNTPGSYMCLCNNGWTGDGTQTCWDADDCEFSPCQHGGTCDDCGTLCLICDCIVGWRGKTCEIDWNECKMGIHTCHDFAECFNTAGSFECQCEPGYSGDGYLMCNEVNDCMRWEDDPLQDDQALVDYATKVYDADGTLLEKSGPVAPAPWSDDKEIVVMNDGVPTPVHQCGEWDATTRTWIPHGSCSDTGSAAFICECDLGWSDSNCDLDIDECARSIADCHKYATCDNSPGSYACVCNPGYTGDGIVSCVDVDDCSAGANDGTSGMCFAGKCVDLGPGDFRCVCNEGYMDRLCDEDIDECASFTHTCMPDAAKCTNMPGSFKCACRKGFTGDGIGPEGCIDINECGSSPCENGVCTDHGQLSWSCTCDTGWMDTMCDHDVNECYDGSHDCHPQAKCVNTPGGFYCRCVSGHTGDGYTCTDLDDCDPDPCDPQHGTCHDNGANRYSCACEKGFAGMGCENDEVECQLGTHECHPDADCFNSYGSYICACKDEFYGDGVSCAPCTDCKLQCADGEERAWINALPSPPAEPNKFMDPTSYACGHGPGYENDALAPACAAIDRTCVQLNECNDLLDNCDHSFADCVDNEGSFTCQCKIQEEKWGTGLDGECWDCLQCPLGSYMVDDCTTTDNRVCRMNIYDGNYAIETFSGGTAQCLVHWKEAGKIFPERYSWGGRLGNPYSGYGSQSVGKYELWGGGGENSFGVELKSKIPSPDICDGEDAPICGVCSYSGKSPAENIVQGMEAVWTFLHLDQDLYLILNGADGNGFRCLGFQTPDAPYPTLLTWELTMMQADEGHCVDAEDEVPILPNGVRMNKVQRGREPLPRPPAPSGAVLCC